VERGNILSDIHHGLGGLLEDPETVLHVSHHLPVTLLVFLQKPGVLLHLIVHLTGKRLDLILKRRVKIMELLLELKKGLEGLVLGGTPGKFKHEPRNGREHNNRRQNPDESREKYTHGRIINDCSAKVTAGYHKQHNAQRPPAGFSPNDDRCALYAT